VAIGVAVRNRPPLIGEVEIHGAESTETLSRTMLLDVASLGQAADRVSLSQPAMSHALKRLRAQLEAGGSVIGMRRP
jgi:hypothetical protein